MTQPSFEVAETVFRIPGSGRAPRPILPNQPSNPHRKPDFLICGQKVLLDADLAELYVTTGNPNLAVRRNQERFLSDFMF